jgi:putative nucleotidyltransferase with HDIG domain
MQDLDSFIDKVKHLPPAPRLLPKLLSLLNDVNADNEDIVQIIRFDPALTAKVLQLCNSAYFAAAKPVADLGEAINRIGFNSIYQMVAGIVGSRLLSPPQTGYGLAQGELWKHSVVAAIASQVIAQDLNEYPDIIFTAGLLHDIGKIVLTTSMTDSYSALLSETENKQNALVEAEKNILGVDHAEIGGRLLTKWNFPQELTSAVTFHHHPDNAGENKRLAACVFLGNMVAHFMGYSYGYQAFAIRGRAEALSILDLDSERIPEYMIQTFERLEKVESFLGVGQTT